jgi:hypothetical protein
MHVLGQLGFRLTRDANGAGFRDIPGADAGIKIGGGVTVDAGRWMKN